MSQVQDLSYLNAESVKTADKQLLDLAVKARENDNAKKESESSNLEAAIKLMNNHEKAAPLKEARAEKRFDKAFEKEEAKVESKPDAKVESKPETKIEEPKIEEPKIEEDKLKEIFDRISKTDKRQQEVRKKIEEAVKVTPEEKELIERYKKLEQLKVDPISLIKELGLTLDDIEKAKLSSPKTPKEIELENQLIQMEKQLRDRDTTAEKEKNDLTMERHMSNIERTAKIEGYDIIEKLGLFNQVNAYMEAKYEETQKIISYKDACEAVEDFYASQFDKIKDSKKIAAKLNKLVEKIQEEEVSQSISNKMVQVNEVRERPMSEAERLQAAYKVLNGYDKARK
jgi:hypothetical protein